PDNTTLINCKIYDKTDESSSGEVLLNPFVAGTSPSFETDPPVDLTEQSAVWDTYYYMEVAAPTSISWDTNDKKEGNESLFLDTESGYDVTIHYFPQNDTIASWYLKQEDSLSFWMKINITDPNNPYGVQDAFIRLGNRCGGYYQYTNDYFQNINPHILNNCIDQWVQFSIPLAGDSTWKRTSSGDITNFTDINYVEINVDVWEYGYEMWIDGLALPYYPTGQKKVKFKIR
ncbi:MAG: hypothetical protein JKY33_05180, partial [Bacteroidia bacterium]|nr:hypothetical protein [Bacteroidia bacterium]